MLKYLGAEHNIFKMIKVLISKESNSVTKKFLIPKQESEDCKEWVEIRVDYAEKVFVAKKLKLEFVSDEWIEYKDYTFPSSLFTEFLLNDK